LNFRTVWLICGIAKALSVADSLAISYHFRLRSAKERDSA
jgi:hypothetical protein